MKTICGKVEMGLISNEFICSEILLLLLKNVLCIKYFNHDL